MISVIKNAVYTFLSEQYVL